MNFNPKNYNYIDEKAILGAEKYFQLERLYSRLVFYNKPSSSLF